MHIGATEGSIEATMTPQTPIGRRQMTPLGQARGAAGNGLLNNLIAYWPGNELSGNALDLHTNALHLTDTNTVTSAAGLVYPTARQYTAVNQEYHSRAGDDALLSTGDIDFTLAAWVYLDAKLANMVFASKYFTATNNREYQLDYIVALDRFTFRVSSNGSAVGIGTATANTLGSPALATWYLLIAWHDSVANTINLQINDAGIDSTPYATGVFDGAAAFRVGSNDVAATNTMNGRIGPTMFWKSNPGLGGILTAAQRTALYNGGAGLTYAAFTT
jgi:hypothetical protein